MHHKNDDSAGHMEAHLVNYLWQFPNQNCVAGCLNLLNTTARILHKILLLLWNINVLN